MAVTAGTVLGHYKIIATLGAGGMGEVYKAEDTTLGRPVALKLLPAHLVEDPDRVRRFVQEAKSASALNHPHIITIYEIGQMQAHDGSDGASTSPAGEGVVHYIAMEFVDGVTLHTKIHRDRTELKKLLEYLVQAGDGLAKAHSAGIVHRDLKPDNIMITSDGYAKILDFGLAKLIEPKEPSGPAAPSNIEEAATAMMGETRPGIVMGTIGYMSPEQALGKEIDQRSDIFSFGCILYEAATGANPFAGESVIDALHKIVYTQAPLIGEINPNAPAELQRIIRKCLAKDPADRYQSIRDISIDLRDLTREYDTQPRVSSTAFYPPVTSAQPQSAASGPHSQNVSSGSQPQSFVTDPQRAVSTGPVSSIETTSQGKSNRRLLIGAGLLILIAIGVALFLVVFQKQSKGRTGPLFQNTSISKLTSTGKSIGAIISPDGKYVFYITNDAGQQSLWVKQVATASNVQIVPPAEVSYKGLTFSPDGNYVYYVRGEKGNPVRALLQIPVLGGTPKQVLEDVDSSITFSPDGKRFAFMRNYPKVSETDIIVVNADGSGEQKLAVRKQPNMYFEPVWSPDGKVIACSARTLSGGFHFELVAIQVADGSEKTIGPGWGIILGLAWLSEGSGLVVTGRDQAPGSYQIQIWQVPYPEGKPRRITSDLNNYAGISLTANSSAIATVQADAVSNIWVVPEADANRANQITSGSGKYAYISWAPDGRIVYVTDASGNFDIWIMNPDGSNQKQLTVDAGVNIWPTVSSDGRYIVFCSNRGVGVSTLNIWRMGIDGSNPKQLTKGDGEFWPVCSPDGKWIVFTSLGTSTKPKLQKVSIDGGDPVQVTDKVSYQPIISPDGKYIACWYSDETGTSPPKLAVFPFEGGEPVKSFKVPPAIGEMVTIHWTADGKAITYLDSQRGVTNIWSQPIDGSSPKQVTSFKAEQIFCYDWSKDGKQLACARGTEKTDVILIKSQTQSEK